MSRPRLFLPGSVVGVMGGGQLGRMFAIAARRMGYRVHTFTPDGGSPTGQLADVEIVSPYQDREAVTRFARGIDVLTFEFENIPSETIEWCAEHCEVRPAGRILHVAQHRLREKDFLSRAGFPVAPFASIQSADELSAAIDRIGTPAVLKTAAFGYDGKGQRTIASGDHPASAWAAAGTDLGVLEGFVKFEKEISVIVARGLDGVMKTYPVCENLHRHHILDLTIAPARIAPETAAAAQKLACAIAEKLELIGVLAVEMFLLADGELVINEVAPRPHNSGHLTFDASVTSQFEQQLRAICGLPLGSTDLLRPSAMANLLGDLWQNGEPNWSAALARPDVKLHLYGKSEPRPGRKMGHLTAFGATVEEAAEEARAAREALARL